MIVGIGVDLVEQVRIAGVLARRGRSFAERVLHPDELALFDAAAQPENYLAKAWAAKEAAAKALGTGIGRVGWTQLLVRRDPAGKPSLRLTGAAARIADGARAHLSLSDDGGRVIAFVVLER